MIKTSHAFLCNFCALISGQNVFDTTRVSAANLKNVTVYTSRFDDPKIVEICGTYFH